jgi:hypothetical protein
LCITTTVVLQKAWFIALFGRDSTLAFPITIVGAISLLCRTWLIANMVGPASKQFKRLAESF